MEHLENKVANKMRKMFLKGIDPIFMEPMPQKARAKKIKLSKHVLPVLDRDRLRTKNTSPDSYQLNAKRRFNSSMEEDAFITQSFESVGDHVTAPQYGRSNSMVRLAKNGSQLTHFSHIHNVHRSQANLSNLQSQTLLGKINFKSLEQNIGAAKTRTEKGCFLSVLIMHLH